MLFVSGLGLFVLAWVIWRYIQARQFTAFKRKLATDIRPQVLQYIEAKALSDSDKQQQKQECIDSLFSTYVVAKEAKLLPEKWNHPRFERFASHLRFVEKINNS